MKVLVDGKEVLNLTETQKKVIKYKISEDIFQEDMERRVAYILQHKYERCFEDLKKDWDKVLPDLGVKSIPTDKDAYAELVFARPEYMDRKARDLEDKNK